MSRAQSNANAKSQQAPLPKPSKTGPKFEVPSAPKFKPATFTKPKS
jgi:hypothetical protein